MSAFDAVGGSHPPASNRAREMVPLPPGTDFTLPQVFEGIGNAGITSVSPVITVEARAP